ncbi:MAG TPA: DUF2630 family protein [Acidimicrobiales bacterium]|nr:DUF2630 family protein [Acidimicrobiales bacterium]
MTDQELIKEIDELVDEERQLHEHGVGRGLTPEEQQRLTQVEVRIDQLWDLLRRRRARRRSGGDPDEEQLRDADTVEHYQQ